MATPSTLNAFDTWLVTSAELADWHVLRSNAPSNSSAPNIVLIRPGEIVIVKTRTVDRRRDPLSPAQQAYLDAAQVLDGVEAYAWSRADHRQIHDRLNQPGRETTR